MRNQHVTVIVTLFGNKKNEYKRTGYCKPAFHCHFVLDIQRSKVSFLGLLSFGFKGLLRAMLFQSIYVQVPSIRLSEGSARGGCAYWMEITHPTAQWRRFFALSGEESALQKQSNICSYMTISNEIWLWMV